MKQTTKRTASSPDRDTDASTSQGSRPRSQNPVTELQRRCGNRELQRLAESGSLQRRLRVGRPNDRYEREAERVARSVTGTPKREARTDRGDDRPSAADGREAERARLQGSTSRTPEVTSDVDRAVRSSAGQGRPFSSSERSYFETRFDVDFSGVRIHDGEDAAEMSDALDARAFTYGSDIYLSRNERTDGPGGRELLAHELTHVVQQTGDREARRQVAEAGSEVSAASGEVARRQDADSDGSESEPSEVTKYRPGAEFERQQGMVPGGTRVESINTHPLHEFFTGDTEHSFEEKWPNAIEGDDSWTGWELISVLSSRDFWVSNLDNASPSPLVVNLPVHNTALTVVNPQVSILARLREHDFINAPSGPTMGGSGTGGGTVSTNTEHTESQSVSGSGELSAERGGVGGSAAVGGEMGNSNSQGSTTTRQGTAGETVSGDRMVQFDFKMDFEVELDGEFDTSTVGFLGTLGIGEGIAEAGEARYWPVGETMRIPARVALPIYRCTPVRE